MSMDVFWKATVYRNSATRRRLAYAGCCTGDCPVEELSGAAGVARRGTCERMKTELLPPLTLHIGIWSAARWRAARHVSVPKDRERLKEAVQSVGAWSPAGQMRLLGDHPEPRSQV